MLPSVLTHILTQITTLKGKFGQCRIISCKCLMYTYTIGLNRRTRYSKLIFLLFNLIDLGEGNNKNKSSLDFLYVHR